MENIGLKISQLDTPTLLVDIDKLKKNINEMAYFAKENNLRLRPHLKTHKSVDIAKMQLQAGASGVTVAKVGEAEVMAASGINDILIAYPIASEMKIKRLITLLEKNVDLKVAVDNLEQIKLLQKMLEKTPYILEVWIKVNSGLNRCGVAPGKAAVDLAQATLFLSRLRVGGIFTHAGHSYGAKSFEEIERIALDEGHAVVESAIACERAGIEIPVRSVGSTPTYKISGLVEGINEIRPGNAIFFDMVQTALGVSDIERCALTVLAGVVGVYEGSRVVFDTGSKSLCLDKGAHGNNTVKGFGYVINHSEVILERLSEEHGVGIIEGMTSLKQNDKVQIIPNHACTVVNQFDSFDVHKNGKVIDRWKVDARGQVQ